MSHTASRRSLTVMATVAAATGMTAGIAAAQTAGPPGWRIVQVVGPRHANSLFEISSVSAAAPRDAWAIGFACPSPCGPAGVLLEHWSGNGWHRLSTPSLPSGESLNPGGFVAAASARDAWVFPLVQGRTVDSTLAWHRIGASWQKFRLTGFDVTSAEDFGRSDTWAFGPGPVSAFRFNGTRWRSAAIPVSPQGTSATGPADLWAVGPRLGSGRHPFALAHWTGSRWHTTVFPRLRLPQGVAVGFARVAALGPRDVWVAAQLAKGMALFPGQLLLHWNGSRWQRVVVAGQPSGLFYIASDGHGGVWITGFGPAPAFTPTFYHGSRGHWARVRVPSLPGETPQLTGLTWIPGTRSLWASGLLNGSMNGSQGVIFKDGP